MEAEEPMIAIDYGTIMSNNNRLLQILPPCFDFDVQAMSKWPRIYWIGYWAVVLCITLQLSPRTTPETTTTTTTSATKRSRVIIARKYFHWVVCILFVPTTVYAPHFQSMAYVMALTVFVTIECLRNYLTFINNFYSQYLLNNNNDGDDDDDGDDHGKENNIDESIVVSHISLLFGCAVPLWMSELCFSGLATTSTADSSAVITIATIMRVLLSCWGLLVLGVGDAMGAVVGVKYGTHPWSSNNSRTIEGSLAMFVSMAVPCYYMFFLMLGMEDENNTWSIWLPAILFTTLLEAFTKQIDNFVLPLAGATIILLLSSSYTLYELHESLSAGNGK